MKAEMKKLVAKIYESDQFTLEQAHKDFSSIQIIKCPYCEARAKLVTGKEIYPHRPDLYQLNFYQCKPCDAYVGCHKNGDGKQPLGRLANAELRKAKSEAHAMFDSIWRDKYMKRGSAYAWLADMLEIDPKDCHIGMFDVAMCNRVVEVSQSFYRQSK